MYALGTGTGTNVLLLRETQVQVVGMSVSLIFGEMCPEL